MSFQEPYQPRIRVGDSYWTTGEQFHCRVYSDGDPIFIAIGDTAKEAKNKAVELARNYLKAEV